MANIHDMIQCFKNPRCWSYNLDSHFILNSRAISHHTQSLAFPLCLPVEVALCWLLPHVFFSEYLMLFVPLSNMSSPRKSTHTVDLPFGIPPHPQWLHWYPQAEVFESTTRLYNDTLAFRSRLYSVLLFVRMCTSMYGFCIWSWLRPCV